ncbi:hypothetical protein RJ639_009901 [Escallonia herrerae]|uniref:Reverse transcriptase RNase H-like domain-containing protein n=1 Tax=Escallonia herrerae TaxID=1293975 RepID=A0AA89AXB0_9ASTE|nr:hypothetical protein RJ639_009901 [Escallonia herrerae]
MNTISGGLATGGSSGQAQKTYAREVCITSQPPSKKQKTGPIPTISFSDDDLKDVKTPHDDPLVITIKAGNFDVKCVLVDNGSSAKVPSAYNAILGRLALNRLQTVVSTYHFKIKFPTEHGIGEVKGDQSTARSNLKEDTKLELVDLLRTYADIFAWTAADMPGIDPKAYLASPPLLSKPLFGETCFYTSVTEVAVSAVLVREEDGVQKPIYYVSKVLQDVEMRYLKIDKIALALIILARRLRPYFQSHTTVVLTDQPFRKVLLSPEASARLVNWSVKLGEFDIQYKPHTAIKAQALADFIVECTLSEEPPLSVAHPQSNGQTENMNRSILQGLKKKLVEAKRAWVDELPKVLWAYQTTPHLVTGETPFLLCYGIEAMLPVEIRVPMIWALHFNEANNKVGLRSNLDLVEEARTRALAQILSVASCPEARHFLLGG